MSKDGFNAEDISSTFARFDNKRRNIVCDESRLEPIFFTSVTVTSSFGSAVLSGFISGMSGSSEKKDANEYKSPIKYSWERKNFLE